MTLRRAIFAAIVATLVFVGCQALVSGDVPAFKCASADPSACPPGMTCDLGTQSCVAGFAEGGDEPTEEDAGDGGADADAGPAGLGATCRVDSECASRLCGTSTMLTTTIVPAGQLPICTRSCCTSNQCPSGFVCFAAATGGNYCVPAARASATPPATGGAAAGAACTNSNQCRSGRCVNMPTLGMRCLDTCCLGADCATPTVCRITSFTTPTRVGWGCGQAIGTKDAGAACAATNECKNDNCIGIASDRLCRPSCCTSASCTGEGFSGGLCAYTGFGSDYWKSCLTASVSAGPKAIGAACAADSECASRYCDGELNRCANVCCTDSDCTGGQRCAPSAVGTPFLRCVP
jgi:hypothetical protein